MNRPLSTARLVGWSIVFLLAIVFGTSIRWFKAEVERRLGLYWYDVKADYAYEFPDAHFVTAEITTHGVKVSRPAGFWDTALLPIRVRSGRLTFWAEPWIEVDCGVEGRKRQYFERRAQGLRYLDLSCAVGNRVETDAFVGLRGHGLDWSAGTSRLLTFRTTPVGSRRILVVAPHPDDAEIAAFGLYRNRDAFVVTISAGNYPDRRLADLFDTSRNRELMTGRLRTWDSIAAPLWEGVPPSRAINLGYFNGCLSQMYSAPDSVVVDDVLGTDDIGLFRSLNVSDLLDGLEPVSSWPSLVNDLVQLVQRIQPEIIVAPHPVLDVSRDHRLTTVALFQALGRVDVGEVHLLLYSNHHVGTEYFPFGPDDGMVSLGPWFDDSLPLAGVYSLALSDDLQTEKLFALDAMHDLRPVPRRPGAGLSGRLDLVARSMMEVWRDPGDYYNYYRRALRPNELFFTYNSADLVALRVYVEGKILSELDDRSRTECSVRPTDPVAEGTWQREIAPATDSG